MLQGFSNLQITRPVSPRFLIVDLPGRAVLFDDLCAFVFADGVEEFIVDGWCRACHAKLL